MCKLVSMKTNFGTYIDVADIKKKCIENIISAAASCEKIDYIILFGSSLEDRCNKDSDIDIVIVSNVSRSKLFKNASYRDFKYKLYDADDEQTYDMLQFDSMTDIETSKDFVCKDIMSKGQLIYKRQAV